MQVVVDKGGSEGIAEMVAAKVGACVPWHPSKAEGDACGRHGFLQLDDDPCGAVIDIDDGFGVDDKPADGGG